MQPFIYRLILILGLSLGMAAAEQPPTPSQVSCENGRLTTKVSNSPIRAFLDAVALSTKVEMILADEIGDDTISAELKNIPLDEALRIVLAAYDAFFYYEAGKSGTHSLRAVWVYPMGTARSLRPVPPHKWAGSRELENSLSDADPRVRAAAYETLMERPDGRSREVLLQALRGREQDEVVRQRALSSAISRGVDIPPAALAELARTDNSEQIRWIALDALAHQDSAREIAEALKMDSAESVRQRANEILGELNAAARRRELPARGSGADGVAQQR